MVLGELIIRVGANLDDLDRGTRQTVLTLQDTVSEMERAGARLSSVGAGLTAAITLPIAGIGFVASRSAMEFETAMANVAKTSDATETELGQLADTFKDMSEDMPTSAAELGNLAAAAAQLGVETEGLDEFAKVMADMNVATNLVGEEGAATLARFRNIIGLTTDEFDELGSTIVALGNQSAATEREIAEMGLRIAGAGKVVGLSAAEVLGFATALSSVGIEAEMGGTAISRTFIEIDKAVSTNSDTLATFAGVAGLTAEQFSQAWGEDASGAMIRFIRGLGQLESQGENAFVVMEQLGIVERRQTDALLRASSASDLFTQTLDNAKVAWQENNALTEEANRFYNTTENQFKALRNELKNAAIDLGDGMLPALRSLIDLLSAGVKLIKPFTEGFAALPAPLQTGTVAALAFVAALGPILFIIGKIIAAKALWLTMASTLGVSLGALGPVLLLIGAAIGSVIAAIKAIVDNWRIFAFEGGRALAAVRDHIRDFMPILNLILTGIEKIIGAWKRWRAEQRGDFDAATGESMIDNMPAPAVPPLQAPRIPEVKNFAAQFDLLGRNAAAAGAKVTDALTTPSIAAVVLKNNLTQVKSAGLEPVVPVVRTLSEEFKETIKQVEQLSNRLITAADNAMKLRDVDIDKAARNEKPFLSGWDQPKTGAQIASEMGFDMSFMKGLGEVTKQAADEHVQRFTDRVDEQLSRWSPNRGKGLGPAADKGFFDNVFGGVKETLKKNFDPTEFVSNAAANLASGLVSGGITMAAGLATKAIVGLGKKLFGFGDDAKQVARMLSALSRSLKAEIIALSGTPYEQAFEAARQNIENFSRELVRAISPDQKLGKSWEPIVAILKNAKSFEEIERAIQMIRILVARSGEGMEQLAQLEKLLEIYKDNAADALNEMADAARDATEAMTNVPDWFRTNLRRWQAVTPVNVGAAPMNTSTVNSGATQQFNVNGDININGVNKPSSQLADEVLTEMKRRAYALTGDTSRWAEVM